jgi:hypothetical protein
VHPGHRLAATLAVPAALALAALVRSAPPAPRPEDAPALDFSAGRALGAVRELAGDGAPRPVGSAANRRASDLLVARFRALGLDTSVQQTFGCGMYGTCALVRNVVARLGPPVPGRRAVLLTAHHDSVGAGPGVADDLSGAAATLEVARALVDGPPPPRPVIFLVTDGEEAALVGAAAFLDHHAAAREVGAVVNLEARGTEGPSILFDTSGAPAWLPRALSALPRPVTTSVAAAVYALLPNDTDLSAFQRAGTPGVNLAFAFGAVRYHGPRDDLAHLDPASLQHQGDSALALVRALAAADLEARPAAPRAWFDVLSLGVVSWPRPREAALAAALAALLAAAVLVRREARPLRAAAWGLAAALLAPAAAAAAAAALVAALRWGGALPRPFVAHPGAIEAAGWFAGAGSALAVTALLGRSAGRPGLLAGSALLLAALSAALAVAFPLATPLGAVPALACAAAEALRGASPLGGRLARAADVLPAAAAAVVLAPIALFLPGAMGVLAVPAAALLVALLLAPAAAAAFDPESPRGLRPGIAALAAAALLAAFQAARPHATADAPERLTFAFHEAEGGARWLAEAEHDALPPAVRAAAPFSPRRAPPFPWAPMRPAFAAPATPLGLALPRVEVLAISVRDGVRTVRARVWSPRGAPVVALLVPPAAHVLSASVDGLPLPAPPPLARRFWGGHRLLASMTTPARGVTVDLAVAGVDPVDAFLVDQSPGLPAPGAPLAASRPATAVPSWDGDATIATAPARL